MYAYELPDIKEEISQIIEKDDFSVKDLQNLISEFFDKIDDDFKIKIFSKIAKEIGYEGRVDQVLTYFYDVIAETEEQDTENHYGVRVLAEEFANSSDDEDFCDGKIYVVIKGLDETSEDVREYNSWEDAERDIDEQYTSCCDDVFMAENILFPILNSIRFHEADYTVNFCSVVEFDATGFEDGREDWEKDWENEKN